MLSAIFHFIKEKAINKRHVGEGRASQKIIILLLFRVLLFIYLLFLLLLLLVCFVPVGALINAGAGNDRK